MEQKTIKTNIIFLIVIIASFLCAIIKLSYISFSGSVDGIDIAAFAKNRNTKVRTLYASRGSIYDIKGESLAQTVNSYTVIAYLSPSRTKNMDKPNHVVDKETTAKKLEEVFALNNINNMSYDYILSLLNNDAYQVELGPGGRNITELLKSQIEALELPGIDFIQSVKRYYKMATLAPYVVGYAKENDEGKLVGEMGIEQYFNSELEGVDGKSTYEADIYGYKLPNSIETTIEPKAGKDIYLTIDSNIQLFLEQEIQKLVNNYEMDWLTFTICDAKTGAILGSASNPTFNLNKLNITSYLNPLVSYQYEPGSTMKIFSFMASMENNNYTGTDTYLSGHLMVDNARIHDFNDSGWGVITYDEGFAYSSNVAASKLALSLGKDKLHEFYDKAGFGKQTGITLPGEVSGNMNFEYKTELATASFGQGITTTPIQNIQALTMIANDGVVIKPYIVDKIVDNTTGEVTYKGERNEVGRAASHETVEKIRSLMYDAIYSNKTDALYYKPSNVEMIGKTGTAQISSNGRYLTGKYDYIRSFAGLFPKEDPKYIVYISVKQFVGSIKPIADAVKNVVEEVAKYGNVANNISEENNNIITLDNYINNDIESIKDKLSSIGLVPIILGNGNRVINTYPNKNTKLLVGSKVFLLTSESNILLPNIIGWSSQEAITLCKMLGIKYNIEGYGNVTKLNYNEGTDINSIDELIITLDSKN